MPLKPAPIATLVTVPLPPVASAAQIHALAFHFGIWLVAQAVVGIYCVVARLIVPVEVSGPPVSPEPVATLVTPPVPPMLSV